jgi:hypothetical protein
VLRWLFASFSQTWLLGYEFPSTFILFQKDKVSILCSASKGTSPHPEIRIIHVSFQPKYSLKFKAVMHQFRSRYLLRQRLKSLQPMPFRNLQTFTCHVTASQRSRRSYIRESLLQIGKLLFQKLIRLLRRWKSDLLCRPSWP